MVKRLSAIFLALMLCVAAFALPASAAYTYEDTELGFSLTLPDEFDGVIELREGIDFTGAAGSDGATLYYLPAVEAGSEGILGYIAVVPKQDYFGGAWFSGLMTGQALLAVGDELAYVYIDSFGGTDCPEDLLEDYNAVCDALNASVGEYLSATGTYGVPSLDAGALDAAIASLTGDGALTRGEVAALGFDILSSTNKDADFTQPFADVDTGTDEAQAIAYLAYYGVVNGYEDGAFRPDEAMTRAEFVTFLQRLLFIPTPDWYGDPVEASDLDENHWAYHALNRAYQDGWITVEDGAIRPDESITAAEAAAALNALYVEAGA